MFPPLIPASGQRWGARAVYQVFMCQRPELRRSMAILWGWIPRNPAENGEFAAGPREVGVTG